MARAIPVPGELFVGDNPSPVRVVKCIMYATASKTSDCDTVMGDVEVTTFATSSVADPIPGLFTVPAGTMVVDLLFETSVIWGADSDVVDMTVGDTIADSGWLSDTLSTFRTTCAAAGVLTKASAAANTFRSGKMYTAATTIEAHVVPVGATAAATGLTTFYLLYVPAGGL